MATINLTATTVGNPANNVRNRQNWADIASVTIAGRISHVELVRNNESEFLSFTMITNLRDNDEVGMTVKFNSNQAGLMKMFSGGHIPNGRQATVIGQIKECRDSYTSKDGVLASLKRPEMSLVQVSVNLGAKPASSNARK